MIAPSLPNALEPAQTAFISFLIVVGMALSPKGRSKQDRDPVWKVKRQQAFIRSLQDQTSSLVASQDQLARVGLEKDAAIEELRLENRTLKQQVRDFSFQVSELETKLKER